MCRTQKFLEKEKCPTEVIECHKVGPMHMPDVMSMAQDVEHGLCNRFCSPLNDDPQKLGALGSSWVLVLSF